MKTIMMLVIITTFLSSSFGQEANVWVSDSAIKLKGFSWDDDLELDSREVYIYDTHGKLTKEIKYYFIPNYGWKISDSTLITYDANDNLIEKIDYVFDLEEVDRPDWPEWWRKVWAYDTLENLIEEIDYIWRSDFNIWFKSHSVKHTFDAHNNLESTIEYNWVPGTTNWTYESRVDFKYDTSHNLIERTVSSWYSDRNQWWAQEREVYAYDENDILNQIEYYNNSQNNWVRTNKVVFVYDSNENLIERVSGSDFKVVFIYDSNENLTQEINYHWNDGWETYCWSRNWGTCCHEGGKYEYNYDANGNLTEKIWYGIDSGEWFILTQETFYWSELPASSYPAQYNDLNFKVYPNPTNNLLTIETDQPDHRSIDIRSLNGQLLYSTKMKGTSHRIDLSSFKKGTYLITIRSKNSVTTKKIIKLSQ